MLASGRGASPLMLMKKPLLRLFGVASQRICKRSFGAWAVEGVVRDCEPELERTEARFEADVVFLGCRVEGAPAKGSVGP